MELLVLMMVNVSVNPRWKDLPVIDARMDSMTFPNAKVIQKVSLYFSSIDLFSKNLLLVSVMTKEERITFVIKKLETAIVKTTLKEPFVMNALRIIMTF